jgi:hypothetical protein
MSSAGVAAVITLGADYALTLAAGTYLLKPVIDRMRVGGQQGGNAPRAAGKAGDGAAVLPGPGWQERQQAYNGLRRSGKDKHAAAAELGIVPETTRRTYEKRFREAA